MTDEPEREIIGYTEEVPPDMSGGTLSGRRFYWAVGGIAAGVPDQVVDGQTVKPVVPFDPDGDDAE